MKKYLETVRVFFKTQLAYRFDVLTSMLFTIAKILLAYVLWGAIFKDRDTVSGMCMRIPGTLFKGVSKVIFYLLLPYGIMATVPTQFFTGTLTLSGLIYSIVVVAAFTAFAQAFWKFGLKNYKSTGS